MSNAASWRTLLRLLLVLSALALPAPAAHAAETCGTATNGATLVPGQHNDVAVDADGRTAYVPSREGQLHAVAIPSGDLRCPLQLGGPVGGIDVGASPGRLFAAVGAEVVEVDTAGWLVVRRYPLGLALDEESVDVGITSTGRALVSTTAHRVVELMLATGVVSPGGVVSDLYRGKIESSRDHKVLAIVSAGNSGGSFALYHAETGRVVRRDLYRSFDDVSIDGTGSRIALSGFVGVVLLDGSAQVVGTVPSIAHGAAMSADGRTAWSLYSDGVAQAVDVARGGVLTGAKVSLPGLHQRRTSRSEIGTAVLAPGGQLVVLTDEGVAIGQPSNASAPDPTPRCYGAMDGAGWSRLQGPGGGIAVADDSRMAWVSVPSQNIVMPIDLVDRSIGCPVAVGSSPRSLAISADGTELLVANFGGEDVSVVDVARGVEKRRVRVPWTSGDSPTGVVAGPDGGGLVVTQNGGGYGGKISRLDATGGSTPLREVRDRLRLGGSGDRRLAVTSEGDSDGMETIQLDAASGDVLRTETLGGQAGAFARKIAIDDSGATTVIARWVRYAGVEVSVLDATLTPVGALSGEAWGVTVAPSGDRAWRTSSGQAHELDLTRRSAPAVLRSLAVPDMVRQGHEASGEVEISRDGRSLVVLTDSGVSVLRPTGTGPTGGAQPPPPSPSPSPSPTVSPGGVPHLPSPGVSPSPSPTPNPVGVPQPTSSGTTGGANQPTQSAEPTPTSVPSASATPVVAPSTEASPRDPAIPQSPVPAATGGTGLFHPLVPTRVYDSRRAGGRIVAGADRTVRLAGVGGVPTQGVQAVVVNVTAVGSTSRSDLQVYPAGRRPMTRTSSLNLRPGPPVAGLVTAVLGHDQAVSLSTAGGAVDVVLDVLGWYGEAGASATAFFPSTPTRVFDSRGDGGAVTAGQDRSVRVSGLAGVPPGASAVAVNVTVTGSSGPSDLQVYPSGEPAAARTSTLNMARGATVANLTVAKLGRDGRLALSTAGGATHVILDVVGWYAPPTTANPGSRFVPVDPTRVLDTRVARAPVQVGEDRLLAMTGAPPGATAVAGTVTAVGASRPLDLQVYPEHRRPAQRTSTVNASTGAAVPNGFVTALGDGNDIRLSISAAAVHVIIDVSGWFTRGG